MTALDAALRDPDGFVKGLKPPVIIDEVQRAPDLLRSVKLVVDRERKPGMFLLTGSANLFTLKGVSESLAGLDNCRRDLGKHLGLAVVLHSGETALALDDHVAAVPMALFFGQG